MQDNGIKKVEEERMKEAGEVAVKGGRKKLILIASALFLVAVMVIVGVVLAKESPARRFRKQMDLGAKYLSEQNYEQAIASYQLALEIDPKSVDAYLGLAEVYVATGNYDEALKVLREGYDKTRDERLTQKIAEVTTLFLPEVSIAGEANADEEQGEENIPEPRKLLIKSTSYDGEGNVTTIASYEYDERGNRVKAIYSQVDGSVVQVTESEYNNQGFLIRETDYDGDGNITQRRECECDGNGNKVKEIIEADPLGAWNEYIYDEKGNFIKRLLHFSRDGQEYIQYFGAEYDEQGRQTKYIKYGTDGKEIWMWYESEPDENGKGTKTVAYEYYSGGHQGFDYDEAHVASITFTVDEYIDFP